MNWSKIWWISFALVELTRVMALKMRWALPNLRGLDTFFGSKVSADFYSGPGRRILRVYHVGIIVPPLLEAVLIAPIIYWGKPGWIMFTLFATSFALLFVARANVKRVQKMARPYVVAEEQPATTVSLRFQTRSLINYRNLPMEALVWIFNIAAAFLIADSVRLALGIGNPNVHSDVDLILQLSGLIKISSSTQLSGGAWLFWPLVLVYIQIGATLMKYALLSWPMRTSAEVNEAVRNYREDVRRYLIRSCDWFRLVFSLALTVTAIEQRFPDMAKGGRWQWLGYGLHVAVVIVILVWYQINARRLIHQARQLKLSRTIPGTRVAPDPTRFRLGGLAYYDPDSPSVLIPSRAGYALNFADRRAYVSLAYVTGLLVLAFIHLRFGWG